MATSPIRLVNINSDAADQHDVLKFEQRKSTRHSVNGRVTAVCTGSAPDGVRSRICSLILKDMSDTGVGVYSQEAMPLNSMIKMFFPPHGPEGGFDATGKVVRSRMTENGYELGIRFEMAAAA